MTCQDVAGFLEDFVTGSLTPDVRGRFEEHVGRCRNCQTFLAQYRATMALNRRAFTDPDADAGTAMPEDLVQAILASVKPPGK